jgi:transcriptional regulator with XRE-family HTH domain
LLSKYGSKIREIREKNKDTLEELAKKMNMSWSALGKLERGERRITPEILEQVAKVYDMPLSFFFGEEITIPDELKDLGIEWVAVIKELKEEGLTPDEVKSIRELAKRLKNL